MRLTVCLFVLSGMLLSGVGCIPQHISTETPQELSWMTASRGRAPNSDDAFSFVVVGDGTGWQASTDWPRTIERINLLKPDFVMSLGGLIEGETEDLAELAKQWDQFDAMIAKLDAPFFYCVGNHDVTNPVMRSAFVERYGRSFYSFNYKGRHFIVLDSHTAMTDEAFAVKQYAWLKRDVAAAAGAKQIFVFCNMPLRRYTRHWRELRDTLPVERTTIFNGQTHDLMYLETDGFATYNMGPGAAIATDTAHTLGNFRMFANVSVDEGQPTVAILPVDEVLGTNFAKLAAAARKTIEVDASDLGISRAGGTYTLRRTNYLPVPVKISAVMDASGWAPKIARTEFTLAPGESAEMAFPLKPVIDDPPKAELFLEYEFTVPQTQRKVTLKTEQWELNYFEKNLTTFKPVTCSSSELRSEKSMEYAVDGIVDNYSYWGAKPYPQWLRVDLDKPHKLNTIQVFTVYQLAQKRYYQYTVEVSADGENWTQVADMSTNTTPATHKGDMHKFAPRMARYIKVNMLYNSANPGVHIVELRAFEAQTVK